MKITFLGSGGVLGVPAWACNCDVCTKNQEDSRNNRTRSSILIETEGKRILVDPGPDFREQMLRHKIKKIDYCLITHAHSDHTASISELQLAKNLHLLIPEKVTEKLNERIPHLSKYLPMRNPSMKIENFKPLKIGNVSIDMIKVSHEKSYEDDTPCYGFLFEENGKRVAYIPDMNSVVDKEKMKNLDIFICDGCVLKQMFGHIGVDKAIELFKEIDAKQMIFTHITHRISHKDLEDRASKHGNIKVAYDGMVIEI
jgi:phosphoribosyl 1,2-cyclic phosphate phosphodiesterase